VFWALVKLAAGQISKINPKRRASAAEVLKGRKKIKI
jgi:hypothetical protein